MNFIYMLLIGQYKRCNRQTSDTPGWKCVWAPLNLTVPLTYQRRNVSSSPIIPIVCRISCVSNYFSVYGSAFKKHRRGKEHISPKKRRLRAYIHSYE